MPPIRREVPFSVYKRQQSQISRRRLYPVTAFYFGSGILILSLALRSRHPIVAVVLFCAGLAIWTLVEYAFHRYVLHGRFPPGKDIIREFMHKRLDPLHWEHHERPFDGMHINGGIMDLLPLFAVALPVSFLAPVYTLPAVLVGSTWGYIAEEWLHHSMHFYNFRNPYFRYLKHRHLYHHSPKGIELGYGISSGLWDIVFDTRFPEGVRKRLRQQRTMDSRESAIRV